MNDRAQSQGVIEVRNPYTGELVGTVPRAGVEDVKRAFALARAFKPTLTRYERSEVLKKGADLLRARTEEASDLITRESGLCKKDSLYEVGRVCDVLDFSAAEALRDDGQAFSCDITPHGRNRPPSKTSKSYRSMDRLGRDGLERALTGESDSVHHALPNARSQRPELPCSRAWDIPKGLDRTL